MTAAAAPSRIVLATERTVFDAGAERVAIALAQRLEVDLHVVLPLASNPEYLGAEPDIALRAEQQAAQALSELREQARAAGVATSTSVRRGDTLWREIVAAAVEEQADLLITRRVGRRGLLARLLVGEMVSQVAAHARCPVMMVPATATGLWSHRVLVSAANATVADDWNARAADPARTLIATLAAAGGATLDLRSGAGSTPAATDAGPGDLIVFVLDASPRTGATLTSELRARIGSVTCPALLVRPAPPPGSG